jgi:hypothetical protein
LYDPDGYLEDMTGMAKGLQYGVTHPVEFAKAVTNWDMWLEDPARALGQLVPELALAFATGGAGAAAKGTGAARRVAGKTDELAALRRAGRSADELVPRGVRGPSSGRDFEPRAAGGPIRSLDYRRATVNSRGVDVVEADLRRFTDGGQLDPAEAGMLARLRRIAGGRLETTN